METWMKTTWEESLKACKMKATLSDWCDVRKGPEGEPTYDTRAGDGFGGTSHNVLSTIPPYTCPGMISP
jgi:hypothetical protein